MSDEFTVPEEYRHAFRRVLMYGPEGIEADPAACQAVLVYLKVGGERLARQYLQTAQLMFREEFMPERKGQILEDDEDCDDAEDSDDLDDDDNDDEDD
jgi:hypothetical protein